MEIIDQIDVRKSFMKDFKLPIPILDKKLFLERVNILNFNKELNNYLNIVKQFENTQNFFDYRKNFRTNAIKYLKKQEQYQNLNNNVYSFIFLDKIIDPNFIKLNNNLNNLSEDILINKSLYIEENLDGKFISIDLKSANFQIFKLLNIIKEKSYEEFLNQFDQYNYFHKSKYIRQYIFGNTNSKRNLLIQKTIMIVILKRILENYKGKLNSVVINNDELVFEYDEKLLKFINQLLKNTQLNFNVEIFKLLPLETIDKKIYYIKDFRNKKTLHTIPKNMYIQAFKKINNMEIKDNDLIFECDNELVKYLSPKF